MDLHRDNNKNRKPGETPGRHGKILGDRRQDGNAAIVGGIGEQPSTVEART